MKKLQLLLSILFVMHSSNLFPNISLPEIFTDNMVLQRNANVKIWGWGKPGEEVTLKTSWSDQKYVSRVNSNGEWILEVRTNQVKGAQEINISGYNTISLKNILLGEVWLVSGQSNMEWSPALGINNAEEAIKNSENDQIRFYTVSHRTAKNPQQDLDGQWVSSKPETMKNFSAIAYFFGKKLQEELDVPIGLINSSWGGTPAEVWMPSEVVLRNENLKKAASLLAPAEWGPKRPGAIYNAMIAPLTAFKIKGILWYQGESNTANADYYEEIFSNLIQSWRKAWQDELPFYYAQIAPFNYGEGDAGVKVREAQRRVLKLPKTGMVVTSDVGNIEDIHPRNKLDPGLRFANLALEKTYGKDINSQPPLFDYFEIDDKRLAVYFKNAEGLRVDTHNKDSQFEISGKDGEFYKAKMQIKKDVVYLSSSEVKNPEFVRFSWGNITTSNIFNEAGLPASSFTTEY